MNYAVVRIIINTYTLKALHLINQNNDDISLLTRIFFLNCERRGVQMKNLIIVFHFLLTLLLLGCTDKGVYVGERKNGEMHGQGTLTFSDGSKYKGEFKEGERTGQGT